MFSRCTVLPATRFAHHFACRRAATVACLETAHPGDDRALRQWLDTNPLARPRCVLGKTEGNGCVNDFTRGYSSLIVKQALGPRLDDTSIIMSGGTEGILTPHFLLFAEDAKTQMVLAPSRGPRLSLGVSCTRALEPYEIGTRSQIEATRDAVLEACKDAGLDPKALCFAQIKCPLLTPERIFASEKECMTHDGYISMGLSRGASALGVALATGELSEERVEDASAQLCDSTGLATFASSVASASAGIELLHSEIFVLGNAEGSTSAFKAAHCVMQDAVDSRSVFTMLTKDAGLEMDAGQLTPDSQRRVRAVLAKADPIAAVRGERTTMCSDSDINATRHSRAAVGGLLSGLIGSTRLYVSGGAEHQGPQGGGPVCVIYEADS